MSNKSDDIITETNKLQDKFEKNIEFIWDKIFVPYLENNYSNKILQKLDTNCDHEFKNFMMINSPYYNRLEEKFYL